MKNVIILVAGVLFGIVLTKAEILSWYRIYEMFRFESFHMYGVIGSAVVIGWLMIYVIRKTGMKGASGQPIVIDPKPRFVVKPLVGGLIFGLGWAMTGACPGPIYTIIGNGYFVFIVVLAAALLGTFTYGMVASKLPQK
ncbi:MAG: YeeE/YedE thiosulfate transporter family protein [Cyclobacteriaceae bacterium]|nr:YeeE/YedE thiosulfate transporter family protein [Cyclobacteriaceae bacterium]